MRSVRRHEQGFGATVAVLMISLGAFALALATHAAVSAYADAMLARVVRTQRKLDDHACADTAVVIRAKDPFVQGPIWLPEFGCTINP